MNLRYRLVIVFKGNYYKPKTENVDESFKTRSEATDLFDMIDDTVFYAYVTDMVQGKIICNYNYVL